MLQLLDNLDLEYTHLQSLNRCEKQPAKNSEIIALTAELSSLKAYIAKLQKVPSQDSGTIKKPTHPPKDSEKESTTINGVTWHYCQKCFNGKGSWKKTHTTAEHVKGAGKGYKDGKEQSPPTPGRQEPSSTHGSSGASSGSGVANLAAHSEPMDDSDTGGLFFYLRLGLYAMLAPSPLLSQLFISVIAYFTSSLYYTTARHYLFSSIYTSIAPSLAFCNEKLSAFYNSVMYYWFIVACSLGIFGFLRPHRHRFTCSPTVSTIPFKSKSPPAPNYRCIHLLFFAYVLLISAHVHAIAQEHLPLHSLCTIPFILSCGSLVLYFHQCRQLELLIIYFPPTHAVNLFNIATHVAVLISHLHLTIHVMVPFFPHLLIKKNSPC
jgi:hypothetical protein